MIHVEAFIALLETQEGEDYIFGHEVNLGDVDPDAFDCSELFQWAGYQLGVNPTIPDGSWLQFRHADTFGTLLDGKAADWLQIRGAWLGRFLNSDGSVGNPFSGARPSSSHIAISLGDGTSTFEARSTALGTGTFTGAESRTWTHGALIPGLDYSDPSGPPTYDEWIADVPAFRQPIMQRAYDDGLASVYTLHDDPVDKWEWFAFFYRAVDKGVIGG